MEVRRKFNETVYFRELSNGECFSLTDEPDDTYMKITYIVDVEGKEWNAVRLYDGDVSVFNECQEVIPISGAFEID